MSSSLACPTTTPVTIRDLLVGSTSEVDLETTPIHREEATAPFCQGIVFYHSCGCRVPEPFFCCRPAQKQQIHPAKGNPCPHRNPALVVAVLPHSCGLRIGNTAASSSEDPGAKEFVREIDTAETLDLVVVEPATDGNGMTSLPDRVAAGATAEIAASAFRRERSAALHRPCISAKAHPFVPRFFGNVRPTPIRPPVLADPTRIAEVEAERSNDAHQKESEEINEGVTEEVERPEVTTISNGQPEPTERPAEPMEPSTGDLLMFWGMASEEPAEVVPPPPTQNWLLSMLTSKLNYARA
ncbi:hypothetical protein F5Y17DRAFT_413760 [Xylariaceae sp. FL0594]|nr:hypothetical protein F5Y17DRAFT_413760 [Xylariaceae sp. FL0594]